jgi:amino acid transporter
MNTMGEETAVGFLATYGGLGVIFMYIMLNLALIVLWVRERRAGRRRSILLWCGVPLAGLVILGLPYWSAFQPGQSSPFSKLPWLFPLLVLGGVVYMGLIWLRRPDVIDRAGEIVMGEPPAPRTVDVERESVLP